MYHTAQKVYEDGDSSFLEGVTLHLPLLPGGPSVWVLHTASTIFMLVLSVSWVESSRIQESISKATLFLSDVLGKCS